MIKEMSTEEWVSCAELATKYDKSKAGVYVVINKYKNELAYKKDGRATLYRKKKPGEVIPMPHHVQPEVEQQPVKPLAKPIVIEKPQVLPKRIYDVTLKKAFLTRLREKISIADKQMMDSILADLEMIKACS